MAGTSTRLLTCLEELFTPWRSRVPPQPQSVDDDVTIPRQPDMLFQAGRPNNGQHDIIYLRKRGRVLGLDG